MTISDLFRQQEEVFSKVLDLPMKKCINYVVSLNQDEECDNETRFFIDQIQDKKMIYNYKKFYNTNRNREDINNAVQLLMSKLMGRS